MRCAAGGKERMEDLRREGSDTAEQLVNALRAGARAAAEEITRSHIWQESLSQSLEVSLSEVVGEVMATAGFGDKSDIESFLWPLGNGKTVCE